jgi:hypothetical protein
MNLTDELCKLTELHETKDLTDQEFADAKRRLIADAGAEPPPATKRGPNGSWSRSTADKGQWRAIGFGLILVLVIVMCQRANRSGSNSNSLASQSNTSAASATSTRSTESATPATSKSATANDNELMSGNMDQDAAESAAEIANAVPQKPLTGKLSAIKLFLDLPQAYWEAESPHVNAKGYDALVAAGVSVPKKESFMYRQGKYLIGVWFDKKSGLAREVSIAPENLNEDLTLNEAKKIVASVGITKPPVKDRENAGWLNWNKQGKVSASFTNEHELFITVEK